ncbi:MAG: adenylate/guanylate cyclase domain-containing protein [Alphaproteobacteria bacterium]
MGTGNIKRRLTAILAADAVGYSRMMGKDEEDTLRVLTAHRAVIDGIIEFHEGRIVSTAGDSVLAEFTSSVEAVRCAVEIQEALKTRNDALPEERRLFFRVGVNLGDVMVKGDDLLGDGVNVAARLESIAEPGGICISSSVYDQIAGKLNLGFVDAGQQALKNISKPVHVYRVAGTGAAAPAAPPKSRRMVTAAAFAGLIAVAAAVGVAWQVGWLPPAARDQAGAAKVDAPRAEEERRAAEERARAEAELARVRAEAEAAKRRAEREAAAAAEANRALEAQRTAEAKARAEAELARARAEAEAIKRQAQAELAAAAKARQEAETKAATETRGAAVGQSLSAPAPASVAAASRFDGQWAVTRSCEAFRNRPAFVDRFAATVSKGELLVERGQRGHPGYQNLRGKPAKDNSLVLTGIFTPGRPRYPGQEAPAYFEGRFDGERFTLKGRYGKRGCSLVIARAGG